MREHALFIQSCLRAHTCRRILSDHSGLRSSWEIIAPWVAHQLSEYYAPLGVQAFAWVPATALHSRAAMELVCRLANCPAIALFSDIDQASSWLQHFSVG